VPHRPPPAAPVCFLLAAAAACGLGTGGTLVPPGPGGDPPHGDDAAGSSGGGSSSGYASSGSSSSGLALGDDASGASDDGGEPDPASDGPPGTCNYEGIWASELTIDVTWMPQGLTSIILASGSGQIKQWIRGSRTQQGMTLTDATVVCGVDLPDFQGTAIVGMETYGVVFPSALFDSHVLPVFTVSGTISGQQAGATYTTIPSAALIGLSMTNPATDPWPATVTTEVDDDMDSKPGVTIDVASGATDGGVYSGVPVGIPAFAQPTVRADKLYVAIRQVTAVSGTVQDCDHISGTVTIPTIAGKAGIDSHVLGCELAAGGDCTTGASSQASFVDNTQPVFTPTGSATFKSLRVPAGTSCASVRQMLP
jgi:hypothetical protein